MREEHSAQLDHLVRRAITFFETDRAVARRCLNDAATLLGANSVEPCDDLQIKRNALRRGGLANWRAKRALAYIEEHLGSKIEIGKVADCVALSKSHFSRVFKQSLGSSPTAYVSTRRVERAKLMISSTRERLSDIALACGFADQSHLNRCFRRIVGISPGVWRRHLAAPKQETVGKRSFHRVRPVPRYTASEPVPLREEISFASPGSERQPAGNNQMRAD
jgi:AraC family transcriptional regulator